MTYLIKGFLETSFVDWDGKVCAVIFLGGCNFRCPFCHNGLLVLEPESQPTIDWLVVREKLDVHRDWLDGVCITGGEPTIWPWLGDLIREIKSLGLAVKLDTNGSRPEVISQLLSEDLIDYLALDYKAPLDDRYQRAIGLEKGNSLAQPPYDLDKIRQTIRVLLLSRRPAEFRTTVVPGFIDEEGLKKMSRDLKGMWRQARQETPALIETDPDQIPFKFVLQSFKPANSLEEKLRSVKPFSSEQMFKFKRLVSSILGRCYLR